MELSADELRNLKTFLDTSHAELPMIPGVKFGTDGIRGIIGRDFTIDLLRAAAMAVGKHLNNNPVAGKSGVVIGHDTRFLAREFALIVAHEISVTGHDIYVTSGICPTPVLAHYTWRNDLAGGIMLTASHNPAEYQGFKFIPHFGGPAMPEDTDRIAEILSGFAGSGEGFGGYSDTFIERLNIVDPIPGYLEHLSELIDFEAIASRGLKVIYDPMYACGQAAFPQALLKNGFPQKNLMVIREGVDPLFGGSMPEPKPGLLDELMEQVKSGFDIGFATDGDADRFAAVDSAGNFFSPNILLFILAHHLIENRGIEGPIARTVATTGLLDFVAKAHGRDLIETAVGFKFISKALREDHAMLGGEESGGFSSAGWVPEKDGIYACLMALEALAKSGMKSISQLADSLYAKYGKLVSTRIDLHVDQDEKTVLLEKALGLEGPFLGEMPAEKLAVDGVKLVMPSGASILLRPSGTEPLVRCYLEASDVDSLSRLEAEVKKSLGLI